MAKYLRLTITYEIPIGDDTNIDDAKERLLDKVSDDMFDGSMFENTRFDVVTESLSEELDNR